MRMRSVPQGFATIEDIGKTPSTVGPGARGGVMLAREGHLAFAAPAVDWHHPISKINREILAREDGL